MDPWTASSRQTGQSIVNVIFQIPMQINPDTNQLNPVRVKTEVDPIRVEFETKSEWINPVLVNLKMKNL